ILYIQILYKGSYVKAVALSPELREHTIDCQLILANKSAKVKRRNANGCVLDFVFLRGDESCV
ncbi:MAG: hypothetical protein NT075_30960, partial [Chloroflexi bacterium]|nr:hypothetical protein [Chloroflexota bacterium]